jgi:membrane protease YdiL (CAAX protease family)
VALPPPPSSETADAAPTEAAAVPREEVEQPRWPLWFPLAAVAIGLPLGIVLSGVIATVAGLDADSPWVTSIVTMTVDVSVVGAVVGIAGLAARPRPWHFGLRGARLGHALGVMAAAAAAFIAFAAIYGAVVQPDNPQTVVEDLGVDRSTELLVAGAFVVIFVAPICEELFFRGFVFRVLRLRMSFWPAAVLSGVLFGVVHPPLVVMPVLAVLGVAFCWVYERTGSLIPGIAMHALNNTLAFGSLTQDGWTAAGVGGGTMLVGCAVAATVLPRRSPAPV